MEDSDDDGSDSSRSSCPNKESDSEDVIENMEAIDNTNACNDSDNEDDSDEDRSAIRGPTKIYPLSYINDSDSCSDDYYENHNLGMDYFHKVICEKLQSKHLMQTDAIHKRLSRFVDVMFPEELEIVVSLFIEAGNILYPLDCNYDDNAHHQILNFLDIFCSNMHISCGKSVYDFVHTDDQPHDCPEKSHVEYLHLGDNAMDFSYDPEYERGDGYLHHSLQSFELHECIGKLEGLKVLSLTTHCTSLPETLTNLKDLHRITIVDSCTRPTPAGADQELATIAFPNVSKIHIHTDQKENTEMRGALKSLLLNSSFPEISELSFEIHNDATQIIPDVLNTIRSNTCFKQIDGIVFSFGMFEHNNQDKDLIPNVFLDLMPQVVHFLPKVNELSLEGKNEQLEGVIDTIARRLQTGEYNKEYMELFCNNLCILQTDFGTNNHAKKQKESMLTILQWFKRLSSISRDFYGDRPSPVDRGIEYLLRLNYGGGRMLIPSTELSASRRLASVVPVEEHDTSAGQRIPVSLWPSVLARANDDYGAWSDLTEDCCLKYPCRPFDATAIYRMLRPNSNLLGPALEGILQRLVKNRKKRKARIVVDSPVHRCYHAC